MEDKPEDKILSEKFPRSRLKSMPELSGVYLMKDVRNKIIYIGKAKNLKARVQSYFNGSDTRRQIDALLEQVNSIETFITEDERQALLLEADLIKRYRPRYNVRLKENKALVYIRIDESHEWPRVELVKGRREGDPATYYGPFPFSYEARTLFDIIDRVVPLRTCSDRVIFNRVRPCLQYQIKRCAAPCCISIEKQEYDSWVNQAISILNGKNDLVKEELVKQINIASDALRYEDAAILRDRVKVLDQVSKDRAYSNYGSGNLQAIGYYREGTFAEVSCLTTVDGMLSSSHFYSFKDLVIDDQEVLQNVLRELYPPDKPIPETILIPFMLDDMEIREEILSTQASRKINLICPQRGVKVKLSELAQINAKESFEARYSDTSKNERILNAFKDTFELKQTPRVIECIDISHFQGSSTVGVVTSFKDGVPFKSRYRYFYLSQEGKPDDFASINEVVARHLKKCIEDDIFPDILLIDGGPPQLVQAIKARDGLGLEYPTLMAIAKKRDLIIKQVNTPRGPGQLKKPERIYLEQRPIPFILPTSSEILKLFERIRNETHRVAIGFHRKSRSKKQLLGPLDEVPGIGFIRKRKLLKIFGSFKHIKEATVEELMNKGGLPRTIAENLIKVIQSRDSSE